MLGIFDIGTDYETLAGILGKVEYSDSCKATTKSLAEVIEIIVKNGGLQFRHMLTDRVECFMRSYVLPQR